MGSNNLFIILYCVVVISMSIGIGVIIFKALKYLKQSATNSKKIADYVDNGESQKAYISQDMRETNEIKKGEEKFALNLVRKGKITIEEASEELGTPVEKLKAKLEESK